MTERSWPSVLGKLTRGEDLSRAEAAWAMERIMADEATPAQFGAFVAALRTKGETIDEIAGLVETMRSKSLKVSVDGPLVDTCGTGGDRAGTINVSTIAAFVVAGAGGRVAKHGNRAASSACGSADLLEELGVKIDLEPDGVARCIDEVGIGFCFAPVFHPSMRFAGPPRKELGVPTIFNFLGPLTNPAGATQQALGVSDPVMAPKMVEVLKEMGSSRVIAFHGTDGLDELTITGGSLVWDLHDGAVSEFTIDPGDYGIDRANGSDLVGGSPTVNATIARQILSGAPGPHRDVVLLNSAAGILAAGLAEKLDDAIDKARESIDSGRAGKALDLLIETSNE